MRGSLGKLAVVATAILFAGCGGLPSGAHRASQPAELHQRLGSTEIDIRYNRPSARGRRLFGALVPYDSVWNPGADEATRMALSQDVRVDGHRLPAGKYSLWAIPRPTEWTVIFSRAYDVYHTPYPSGRDALRIRVRPDSGAYVETLTFEFPLATRDSARLDFRWGRVDLPLSIRPIR